MKKNGPIFAYIIFGLIPTIFLFMSHDWMCKYDMNFFCYFDCVLPAILGAPILCLGEYND